MASARSISSIKKDDVSVVEQARHLEATPHIVEIDSFRVLGLSVEDADFYTNYPAEKVKKIFRKVRKKFSQPLSQTKRVASG